jgi:hypothetical protein
MISHSRRLCGILLVRSSCLLIWFNRLIRLFLGFTILDNVFISNGTVYIVTDDPHSIPAMSSIIAAVGPGMNSWEVISVKEAKTKIGQFGGV